MKTLKERLHFLSRNAVFFSRLGFGYDPPKLDENGQWILFDRDFGKFIRSHLEFSQAGVAVHTRMVGSGTERLTIPPPTRFWMRFFPPSPRCMFCLESS